MSTDLFDLRDQLALVTGASGWLGSAMVAALAGAGAEVVAVGRRVSALAAVLEPLREAGHRVSALVGDVTEPALHASVRTLAAERGRVDIVVNNAHVGRGGSLRTSRPEDFEEAFGLAVTAPWQVTEAARAGLVASAAAGGSASVVNVASMYGLVAPDLDVYATEEGRNPPFYGAAKAGLLQLTRYAAAELGREGVRVNAISPGPFPADAARADDRFVGALAEHTMLGRLGEPEDLATALLFLVSPHSRFVTGATIVVDGGWTAR